MRVCIVEFDHNHSYKITHNCIVSGGIRGNTKDMQKLANISICEEPSMQYTHVAHANRCLDPLKCKNVHSATTQRLLSHDEL